MELVLAAGPARVTLDPEHGGRIASLRVDRYELLVNAADGALDWGCFPMAPYAGRVPFAGNVAFPGVDLRLATLAVRAESSDAAERHFADADALHSRLDAPIWLAETRLAWGRFLLERERDRALPLLQSARELADRMGAADIRQAADELLASA